MDSAAVSTLYNTLYMKIMHEKDGGMYLQYVPLGLVVSPHTTKADNIMST